MIYIRYWACILQRVFLRYALDLDDMPVFFKTMSELELLGSVTRTEVTKS
jgi:hypothetical protein